MKANAVIQFSNEQSSAKELEHPALRTVLAEEMWRVAFEQVPGALSGRTIEGLYSELFWHYYVFDVLPIFNTPSKEADMGGTDKKQTGYDSNASIFESLLLRSSVSP